MSAATKPANTGWIAYQAQTIAHWIVTGANLGMPPIKSIAIGIAFDCRSTPTFRSRTADEVLAAWTPYATKLMAQPGCQFGEALSMVTMREWAKP